MAVSQKETTPDERRHMRRALALARQAEGRTAPNPMVGCVIVKNDEVIGEGFHKGPGLPHAEAAALCAVGDRAHGATAYVTLEPCNHHGRTPPCVDALISAGIAEVVFAVSDSHPVASGGGSRLAAAGVKVRSGLCEAEARELNRAWLHSIETGRPYVVAKAAMSLDGRIATRDGESKWITSEPARRKGHELRRQADAIIVGAGTVIADDPALTARIDDETHYPLRVVLDSNGRTSPGAKIFERSSGPGALLATTSGATRSRLDEYSQFGVDVEVFEKTKNGRVDLRALMRGLHARGVIMAMVEGGGETLGAVLDEDLIDEVWLFLAPMLIGGGRSAFSGDGPVRLRDAARFDFDPPQMVGPDVFLRGRRNREGR